MKKQIIQKLYSQQTINVYLKNVKMTNNEEKNLKDLKDSIKDRSN